MWDQFLKEEQWNASTIARQEPYTKVVPSERIEKKMAWTRATIDRVIGKRVNALNSIAMAELRDELYKELGV